MPREAPDLPDLGPIDSRVHVPALDGIRGAAILLVVIFHSVLFSHVRPTTAVDRLFVRVAETGWIGVDLFFVLSGFLITGILDDAKGGRQYFRNFYARRVLRIFPLYYGFLCVLFFLLPPLAPDGYFAPLVKDQVWYWTYLTNVSVATRGWTPVPDANHFWSLAVEEQFYLIWPWVVFALSRRALMRTCLALVGASLAVRVALHATGSALAATVLTPARMDGLAIGAFIALATREPGGLARLRPWVRTTTLGSAAVLTVLFFGRHGLRTIDPAVSTVGYTLLALLFGATLVATLAAAPGGGLARVFAHRSLQAFGRYSYAQYVFHLPIIFWIHRRSSFAFVPRLADSNLPGQLLFTVLAIGLSLGAAIVSWHLYEARFLKLKTLFPYERP